jgi:hypothetical protein
MLDRLPSTPTRWHAVVCLVMWCLVYWGCGTQRADGTCKDYQPISCWNDEYVRVCETTDDGCEQCTCVTEEEARRMRR